MPVNNIRALIERYDARCRLDRARTIPCAWYLDQGIHDLEREAVFGRHWQVVGRRDQLRTVGQFMTANVAGEPIVVVRGEDGLLRGFFNVCRHHAAAVAVEPAGSATVLQCPYHGWTYALDGRLRRATEFEGVRDFDVGSNGLVPVAVDEWEHFVFVRLADGGVSLAEYLHDARETMGPLNLTALQFFDRRVYELECNWKVFVDNYLDGGYHVPYAHKSLNSVLDYRHYEIRNFDHCCVQSSPMSSGGDAETAAVRGGERACYLWIYPNFMVNWYEGVMDTNLVVPLSVSRTRVIFDFYFGDVSEAAQARNSQSVSVADRVQIEDHGVCESVQIGLGSRAYDTGRLSVRREAGEQLFHQLLHSDFVRAPDCHEGAVER